MSGMEDLTIDARKQELLEARFWGASKMQSGSESNMSTGSSLGAGANSDKETDSALGFTSTPEQNEKGETTRGRKRKAAENLSQNAKKVGANSTNSKKINDYFEPATSPARNPSSQNDRLIMSPTGLVNPLRSSPSSRHGNNSSSNIDYSGLVHLQQKRHVAKETRSTQSEMTFHDISHLQTVNSGHATEKSKKLDEVTRQKQDLEFHLKESDAIMKKCKVQLIHCLKVCKDLLVEKSKKEKIEARKKAMEGRLRLGQFSRQGTGYQESWTNGWAFADLGLKKEKINREKEDIEKARKILNKRKPSANAARKANNPEGDGFTRPKEPKDLLSVQEYHERDEVLRQRLSAVKRDENELQFELERLERERSLHIRELKRISNEDNSCFKDNPVLNDQYLLLSLLGKGGFSEVYKGFDLEELRYVAVKIHHLNREWHEQKKLDYARHANREADIHRSVNHPRIVSLYDRFEVDINTFCTVLEFCGGNDLDFYLKEHRLMGEKEARTIIMQVVSALVYLNSLERSVIHYDLKPGNILLCHGTVCGDVKVTDFGLSKQFDEGLSPGDGMDLTSQGAGTYWYLPPECFVRGPGGQPPKIDNKVDVWSVGVIFYQCLYGKKPFGHNLTQEAILKQNTILRATEVSFPNKPTVSAEAKSFIRRCLMYHKEDRADVFQLADHPYLKPSAGKRGTASSANSNQNGPAL